MHRSKVLAVPYGTVDSINFNQDGTAQLDQLRQNSLLWVSSPFNVNRVQMSGELLFVNDKTIVSKNQCLTSDDLQNVLIGYFHGQDTKEAWHTLQQRVLKAMHDHRAPGSTARAACQKLIAGKRC
jgi:hypothetical protein